MATSAVLRGASVLDGTGAAAARADVAIADGRIVGFGPDLGGDFDGFDDVDLSGLVLSPGFIDPHTHYDAQIFWDPDLTPSSWHGVTTVVMGNCGFTVAPTRPEHRDTIARTLANVEGMSLAVLEAGLPWTFETFPDYLRAIDALPKRLNAACLIGHTALRWYVLGDDATDREATEAEVDRMCLLVREALDLGAVGFSSSQAEHTGAYGKPVPSRAASRDEVLRLAGTLNEAGAGTIEIVIGDDFDLDALMEVVRAAGRPVTWSGRVIMPTEPHERDAAAHAVDYTTGAASASAGVYPQFGGSPIVHQVNLLEPLPLRVMSPAFLEVMGVEPEQRLALYKDEAWRRRAKEQLNPAWVRRLESAIVQETEVHTAIRNGPTLGELAARDGKEPFDLLVDLSIADGLATRFRIATGNSDEVTVARNLADPRCLLGVSDAGAHASQLCDANFATHLLGHWVRERGVLPLEQAVWRLTGHPAAVFGLRDRGRVAVGAVADLVAFDAERVGTSHPERVWDFPTGADRLVAYSTGIEHVWVNGTLIREAGADVPDVIPGELIRV